MEISRDFYVFRIKSEERLLCGLHKLIVSLKLLGWQREIGKHKFLGDKIKTT